MIGSIAFGLFGLSALVAFAGVLSALAG